MRSVTPEESYPFISMAVAWKLIVFDPMTLAVNAVWQMWLFIIFLKTVQTDHELPITDTLKHKVYFSFDVNARVCMHIVKCISIQSILHLIACAVTGAWHLWTGACADQ